MEMSGLDTKWQYLTVIVMIIISTNRLLLFAFENLKVEVVHQKLEKCEKKVENGDLIRVHYVGKLARDGSVFDSSYERGAAYSIRVGRKQVISGWDQGVLDMCVGEERTLFIPARLAYGETATDKIPANSDLIFDVKLLEIDKGPSHVNVFRSIDADADGQLSRDELGDYLRKQIPADVRESNEIPKFDEDKMVEEIFQHEDKDKNGFISHDEFSGPKHDEL